MRFHFNGPSFVKAALVATLSVMALSACQTNSRAGKGSLDLSYDTKRGLQAYMQETFPTIFAASTNGKGYSYYYCATGGCRGTVSTYQKVLDKCEQRSKAKCRLLAISRNIVWQKDNGETYTLEELQNPPKPRASLGAMALCEKAYDKKSHYWSTDDAANPYISEIQKRGFTVDFCAKLNNQVAVPRFDIGNIALCTKAFDKDSQKWSTDSSALPYVTEAEMRGLTSNFCAKLTTANS